MSILPPLGGSNVELSRQSVASAPHPIPIQQPNNSASLAIINTLKSLQRAMADNSSGCTDNLVPALQQLETNDKKNRVIKAWHSFWGRASVDKECLENAHRIMSHMSTYIDSTKEVTELSLQQLEANQRLREEQESEKQKALDELKQQYQRESQEKDDELKKLREKIHLLESRQEPPKKSPKPRLEATSVQRIDVQNSSSSKEPEPTKEEVKTRISTENNRLRDQVALLKRLWEESENKLAKWDAEKAAALGALQSQIDKLRNKILYTQEEKESALRDLEEANVSVDRLEHMVLKQKKELHSADEAIRNNQDIIQRSRDLSFVKSLLTIMNIVQKACEESETISTNELLQLIKASSNEFKDHENILLIIYANESEHIRQLKIQIAEQKVTLSEAAEQIAELQKQKPKELNNDLDPEQNGNNELLKAVMGLLTDIAGELNSENKSLSAEKFQQKIDDILGRYTEEPSS